MRLLFNVICFIAAALLVVSIVSAGNAADPWPHETRNNLFGIAFIGAVCAGTNYYWRRK